jgi:hypothetical protein
MSTVQEIESALRQLRPGEMRAVRDWIDEILEDQLEFTPEFAAKIARSEREMDTPSQNCPSPNSRLPNHPRWVPLR